MKKVITYVFAYVMWIVDLGLALWFAYLCRTDLLSIFALFYQKENAYFRGMANVIDRVFLLILGLGWLAFMIFVEQYYRVGIRKKNLLVRITSVTGPLVLAVFVANLILFWVKGIGRYDWLSWLILAVELGVGIALIGPGKTQKRTQPH